jgi:hypothetical protein
MTRWEALVQFDDEIRTAAAKLFPFGAVWVDRLGEAFFALKEDRSYLPNIVARLGEQAILDWLAKFSVTASGEKITEEALTILADATAKGYQLSKGDDDTIRVCRNSSTTFLRSNADIIRFGKFYDAI